MVMTIHDWNGLLTLGGDGSMHPVGPMTRSGGGDGESGGVRIGRATGGCRSFDGDTEVLLADGTSKAFKDLRPGDEVLATDPVTGQQGGRKIEHVWVHDDDLFVLTVQGERIVTTEDHPFWNATDGRWERTDELSSGDKLLMASGHVASVDGFNINEHRYAAAYNLTVDDLHTYYVLAGTTPVLVHNDPEPVPPIVQNAIDAYNRGQLSQRMTGPAGRRSPDVFRGDTGPIGARRFWKDAKIYDVPGGGNDWRLLVKADGTVGWVGPTGGVRGAGHNYDRISTYKPPSC
jgi:hypothetical protein